jgi:hypothetical protein
MAENSPPRNVVDDYDPDPDTEGEDNPTYHPKPLVNPSTSYRLFTDLYNSLEELKADLHKFAASTGFYIVKSQLNNKVKGLGYTNVNYVY